MPVYQYRCTECDNEIEETQSYSDEPLVFCPECSEPALRKVYGPIGIQFRGGGFYSSGKR